MKKLTESETIVMQCIWKGQKDVTIAQIMQWAREDHGKDWKQQTVSTHLSHLAAKGYVDFYTGGRVSYYRPLVDVEDYKRDRNGNFLNAWYGGSISNMGEKLNADGMLEKAEVTKVRKILSGKSKTADQ